MIYRNNVFKLNEKNKLCNYLYLLHLNRFNIAINHNNYKPEGGNWTIDCNKRREKLIGETSAKLNNTIYERKRDI